MLSAFTARPVVELKQRDKSKIESVLTYGDRLLVGLNTGVLRIYRVTEVIEDRPHDAEDEIIVAAQGQQSERAANGVPKPRPVELLREEDKFSRRPVQQLAIIKEANILVSLSDGYVSIHDLQSYALQERLERTRGATMFAVTSNIVKDPTTGIPSIVSRLAVAVKRRLILWNWHDMELVGEAQEITIVASIKSITWASGVKVILGTDPGFLMLNVESQEVAEILRPTPAGEASGQAGSRFGAVSTSGMGYMGMGSWVPKPMATRLSEGRLLLARDVNTLFIDEDGKALEKRQIPWAAAPEFIGYSYPFLLALQSPAKGILEVRNPDTLSLLQSISLPSAAFLHVPQPNISLAHAGKGFLVASERVIWRMGALDYDSQIEELAARKRYDEAISLLSMLEDSLLKHKEASLREIKTLKAHELFQQRKYRDALDMFSAAQTPPARVIALFPRSISGILSMPESIHDTDSEAEQEEPTSHNTTGGYKAQPESAVPRTLLGKLKGEQKRGDSDTASIKSAKLSDGDGASIRDKHTETVQPDRPMEGKDLIIAVGELCSFLVQSHAQILKFLSPDGKLKQPLPSSDESQNIEKPSFHYLIQYSEDAGSADWEQRLRETATLVDTTLFRGYMLARPALAGSLFRLDNFCDPTVVREKLYESGRYAELIDFLHGKGLHREALELLEKFGKNEADDEVVATLRGAGRTVGYLQQLPPSQIDLILEYAQWPLTSDPSLGMEVFLADTENAESLPRHRVLDFLQGISNGLAIQYLEHIITELNDQTPEFHQRLIDLYLQQLSEQERVAEEDPKAADERLHWRRKLQEFLERSAQYNRARAFRQLPAEDPTFFESRAIVLNKMGQHKQALQIYVFQIKDFDKAEDYCNKTFLAQSADTSTTPTTSDPEDSKPSIYHTLLSLYLSPPPPHLPNWAPALALLSRHGARLPASSTLELIPSSLPVADLENYFKGRIRAANSVANEERIVSRLRAVEKVNTEARLLLGEEASVRNNWTNRRGGKNRKIVIGEDRHCAVCHKRFGGSAIRVYPDNTIVHYGCFIGGPGSERGNIDSRPGLQGMTRGAWI